MSNDFDDDDELFDPFENSGGGGGAPVVSWKYARPGEQFTGVVLPPLPLKRPDKGYKMGREYQNGTDTDPDDKGFMVWPPKNNAEKIKRPVTEMKFRELWPDEELPTGYGKVSRVEVTFQTDYVAGEFLSDNFKERLEEDEKPVSGEQLRRIAIAGADLPKKVEAALKAIKAPKPAPGQRWTVTLTKRESNAPRQGTTSRYDVVIVPPTDETRALVAAHVAKAQAEADAVEDAADPTDPYNKVEASSSTGDEAPPF